MFDNERFIPARQKIPGAREFLKQSIQHIEQEGLIMIYPSAGLENFDDRNLRFKKGFKSLIKRLDPQTMVYAFHIEPRDVYEIAKSHSRYGPDSLPFNRKASIKRKSPKNENKVHFNEKYTRADEWLSFSKKNNEKDLSFYYAELFNLSLSTRRTGL
ncbi:MAG: hypothetical protein GF347_02045 [Candidatus Moranbacteria bacterium]|nr:hypothetical protein [Candidatus Moranbacteria bacterium]